MHLRADMKLYTTSAAKKSYILVIVALLLSVSINGGGTLRWTTFLCVDMSVCASVVGIDFANTPLPVLFALGSCVFGFLW